MLKELDNNELMNINAGGHSLAYWAGYYFRSYVDEERSPQEQARIREMNRQHYGY